MSRLSRRLQQMHEHHETKKQQTIQTAQVLQQLGEAGDALELAARVADGAYRVRPQRPEESEAFRVGFATAGKEIALLLRAMRKQEMPSAGEMAECREQALNEAGGAVVLKAPVLPEEAS